MPDAQTPDSGTLPSDMRTLIMEWLPEHFPAPKARPDMMLTESGRMTLAQEYGKYDLCRVLKEKLEKAKGNQ